MATGLGPFIAKGITFGYDTGVPIFSNNRNTRYFKGRPTTNLSSGYGMSTYNNVPSNVTSDLTTTSETLFGAAVIKQTLTPVDATGASYLTNGNNPGIGVVTSGGGGTANRYTGHSIFFKPTVEMHSSPIFTHYSNIGGWQSTDLYEYVGDGWYRAYVIWYNTITQSDGKYWAINPKVAFTGVPIVIYWAGPFKEDLNVSTVSPYVYDSRGNTDSLIDLSKSRTINVSSVSFDGNNKITFDGTDDTIDTGINITTFSALSNFTFELVVKITSYPAAVSPNVYGNTTKAGVLFGAAHYAGAAIYWTGNSSGNACTVFGYIRGTDGYRSTSGYGISVNQYYHIVMVNSYSTGHLNLYVNGELYSQVATATANYDGSLIVTAANVGVSKAQVDGGGEQNYSNFNGEVAIAKTYNSALNAAKVLENYSAYRKRFGI